MLCSIWIILFHYPWKAPEGERIVEFLSFLKPRAEGRNIVGCKAPCKRTQQCWLTTPNIVGCYMLRCFAHPVACCWMLLRVVAQSLKPVKLFSQQLPTFLLFRDRRSLAQQCWSLMGRIFPTMNCRCVNIVRSCCIHLHTTANTDTTTPNIVGPTIGWELMHPIARSL